MLAIAHSSLLVCFCSVALQFFCRLRVGLVATELATTTIGSKFDEQATIGALRRTLDQRGIFGRLTFRNLAQSAVSGRATLFDEQLVVANILNQFGPYVGITRPGEAFLWGDVGSAKKALPDDQWRDFVKRLFTESAAIVIEAGGASEGLMWEIGQIVGAVLPRKVLLIASPSDGDYAQFYSAAYRIFPKGLPSSRPPSRFILFGDDWQPHVLRAGGIVESLTETSCQEILKPFFQQCGFDTQPQPRKKPD